MTGEDINKKVFERYPKKKKEETCVSFADRRNGLRQAYRRRLLNEYSVNDIKKVGEH